MLGTGAVDQRLALNELKDTPWHKPLSHGGDGLSLAQAKDFGAGWLSSQISDFNLNLVTVSKEVFLPSEDLRKAEARFVDILAKHDRSSNSFLVMNFDQGKLLGHASAGHFSVLGAYDAKKHQLLVLDVDPEEISAYWVSVGAMLASILTVDCKFGCARGVLEVELRK